jgi:hypothetical protein
MVYSLQVLRHAGLGVSYLDTMFMRKRYYLSLFRLRIIIPIYIVWQDRLLTIRRKHYLHSLRIIMVSGCVGLLPLLFTPQGTATTNNL